MRCFSEPSLPSSYSPNSFLSLKICQFSPFKSNWCWLVFCFPIACVNLGSFYFFSNVLSFLNWKKRVDFRVSPILFSAPRASLHLPFVLSCGFHAVDDINPFHDLTKCFAFALPKAKSNIRGITSLWCLPSNNSTFIDIFFRFIHLISSAAIIESQFYWGATWIQRIPPSWPNKRVESRGENKEKPQQQLKQTLFSFFFLSCLSLFCAAWYYPASGRQRVGKRNEEQNKWETADRWHHWPASCHFWFSTVPRFISFIRFSRMKNFTDKRNVFLKTGDVTRASRLVRLVAIRVVIFDSLSGDDFDLETLTSRLSVVLVFLSVAHLRSRFCRHPVPYSISSCAAHLFWTSASFDRLISADQLSDSYTVSITCVR